MAAGDIVQIKLTTNVVGKTTYNIFYYMQQAGGSIPGDLAATVNDAFWASINGQLRACLHPSTVVNQSELVFLTFLSAWNVKTINATGQWSDVSERGPAPRYNAIGLRYNRVAIGQRHGYKRFSGAAAEAIEDGGWNVALGALATTLATAIQGGFTAGTTAFLPFVAHRPIVLGMNPTGYVPGSVSYYDNSTQNSRK